ncbi:TIGR00269 family protein [Persephonella sp.]
MGLRKGTKCRICKTKGKKTNAVVFLPQHRLALCKEHFIEWFEKRVEKTIKEFRMFHKNEKILVSVSGGKDSLALWNALIKLGYNADGFYIDLGIGDYSETSKELAKKFAERVNKTLHIVELKKEFYPIPTIDEKTNRPACSACGVIKRYYMNKYARELGYSVIATGHNLDDEVAVLFGNTLQWDLNYLSRQYPVLREENGFIRKVKPLCKITEKESALYSVFNNIEYIEYECPFSEGASSIEYKLLLNQLEEKHPGTKLKFYSEFLKKVYPIFKEFKAKQDKPLNKCKICGEPSYSEICGVCRLKREVENKLKIKREVSR